MLDWDATIFLACGAGAAWIPDVFHNLAARLQVFFYRKNNYRNK
jgi:hypothetical protein